MKVACDSRVEQVLEVVMKTRREKRGGDENLVEVSPDGRRRFLEAEEKPLEVMQAWPSSSGWRLEVERNMEEETHLWWRRCSNFGCGNRKGHYN